MLKGPVPTDIILGYIIKVRCVHKGYGSHFVSERVCVSVTALAATKNTPMLLDSITNSLVYELLDRSDDYL